MTITRPSTRSRRRHLPWAVVAMAALSVGACDHGTAPVLELAAGLARWDDQRPAAYRFTLQHSCYCLDESTRPVIVEVEGDAVVAVRYAVTGERVPDGVAGRFPSIDGLFQVVAQAIDRDADQLSVAYHPRYGYPRRIVIDYETRAADDEHQYVVSDFEAR